MVTNILLKINIVKEQMVYLSDVLGIMEQFRSNLYNHTVEVFPESRTLLRIRENKHVQDVTYF